MKETKSFVPQPLSQRVYGGFVYWLSILAALICTVAEFLTVALPGRNNLNPQYLFSAIWQGKSPSEVWQTVGKGFPGGHFWMHTFTYGDGLLQFGLVVGCASAGIALFATAIAYATQKPRALGWAAVSLLICIMIGLAAIGVYQQGT
jgi:hypothetical protein